MIAVALLAVFIAAMMLPPVTESRPALATSIAQSSSCTAAGADGSAAEGEGRVEPEQGTQDTAGEKQLNVDVMIQPFILSSVRPDNVTVSFRLCDAEDGSTIPHVNYEITISKISEPERRVVMQENFHSHSGPLILQSYAQEKNANATIDNAMRENFTNGWLADSSNAVRVKNMITSSGIYSIGVKILGAEDDRNLYPSDSIPAFYYTAFVSESFPQRVQDLHNATAAATYNMTLLSFHNAPQNFTFNQDEGRIAWSIPFNWSRFLEAENKSGMGSVSQVIVFSDPLFDLSTASRDAFSLAVNGYSLDEESSIRAYDAGSSYTKSPTLVATVTSNNTLAIAEELAARGEPLPQTMDFVVSTQSVRIMPEFSSAALLAVAVAAMMAAIVVITATRKNMAR